MVSTEPCRCMSLLRHSDFTSPFASVEMVQDPLSASCRPLIPGRARQARAPGVASPVPGAAAGAQGDVAGVLDRPAAADGRDLRRGRGGGLGGGRRPACRSRPAGDDARREERDRDLSQVQVQRGESLCFTPRLPPESCANAGAGLRPSAPLVCTCPLREPTLSGCGPPKAQGAPLSLCCSVKGPANCEWSLALTNRPGSPGLHHQPEPQARLVHPELPGGPAGGGQRGRVGQVRVPWMRPMPWLTFDEADAVVSI